MKVKDSFVLRQIAETWTVLPLGAAMVDFNGMLTLNDAGARLWRAMEQECEPNALVEVLTAVYDVTKEQASADVDEFIEKLRRAGCIEE